MYLYPANMTIRISMDTTHRWNHETCHDPIGYVKSLLPEATATQEPDYLLIGYKGKFSPIRDEQTYSKIWVSCELLRQST